MASGVLEEIETVPHEWTLFPSLDDTGKSLTIHLLRPKNQHETDIGGSDAKDVPESGSQSGSSEYSDVEEVEMALWAYVWATNSFLGEMLLGLDCLVEEEFVVEIGAGVGALGLLAAKKGCRRVVVSDIFEAGLRIALESGLRNGLVGVEDEVGKIPEKDGFGAVILDWNKLEEMDSILRGGAASLVVASDVLYLPSSASPMLGLVSHLLKEGGTALIADPGRPAADEIEKLFEVHDDQLTRLRLVIHHLKNIQSGDGKRAIKTLRIFHITKLMSDDSYSPQSTKILNEMTNIIVPWTQANRHCTEPNPSLFNPSLS